jgi:hypothetical protein
MESTNRAKSSASELIDDEITVLETPYLPRQPTWF